MKKGILFLLFIICSQISFCQNRSGNVWVFGAGRAATSTFIDTNKPIILPRFPNGPLYHWHGHSNICDSATSKLLFSCNGMVLYDSNCVKMENGDSLVPVKAYTHNAFPNAMYTQSTIILPKGNTGLYYVIVCTITDTKYTYWNTNPLGDGRFPHDLLLYHIVDINANNGLGKVISKNNVLLSGKEMHKIGMMACRHANGRDWWLLKQGQYDTNQVIRFLVTPDSIAGPWIQNVNMWDPITYKNVLDLDGQYAFSADGSKFAYVKIYSQLYLADFDRCTGELYNSKLINIPIDTTPSLDPKYKYDSSGNGVSFSPNGQFVYISKRWNLYQYEHNQPDSSLAWYHIIQGPDTTYQKFQYYSSLHRGIDGRIYIGNWGAQYKQMSVIDKPDIKGVGCQFCRKCFRLDDTTFMGFGAPPDMPDFNLGASGQVCWPLSMSEFENLKMSELEVYPNPSSTVIYIKNKTGKKKELYNLIGELLCSTFKNEIDVSSLSKGVYFLKCDGETRKVVIE